MHDLFEKRSSEFENQGEQYFDLLVSIVDNSEKIGSFNSQRKIDEINHLKQKYNKNLSERPTILQRVRELIITEHDHNNFLRDLKKESARRRPSPEPDFNHKPTIDVEQIKKIEQEFVDEVVKITALRGIEMSGDMKSLLKVEVDEEKHQVFVVYEHSVDTSTPNPPSKRILFGTRSIRETMHVNIEPQSGDSSVVSIEESLITYNQKNEIAGIDLTRSSYDEKGCSIVSMFKTGEKNIHLLVSLQRFDEISAEDWSKPPLNAIENLIAWKIKTDVESMVDKARGDQNFLTKWESGARKEALKKISFERSGVMVNDYTATIRLDMLSNLPQEIIDSVSKLTNIDIKEMIRVYSNPTELLLTN